MPLKENRDFKAWDYKESSHERNSVKRKGGSKEILRNERKPLSLIKERSKKKKPTVLERVLGPHRWGEGPWARENEVEKTGNPF